MNSKTTTLFFGFLIAILGLFIWGYSTREGTTASVQNIVRDNISGGMLVSEEKLHDFGRISMRNGDVSKEFVITNSSDRDIVLSKILTSCMCTLAYIVESNGILKGPFGMAGHGVVPKANEIIKAGENRTIRAVFDPNAHGPAGVGRIDRFISLIDEDGNTLQFEIKATVTP